MRKLLIMILLVALAVGVARVAHAPLDPPPRTVTVSWTYDPLPYIEFEVWSSDDMASWRLVATTQQHSFVTPADKPKEFFCVRARDIDTGLVSDWAHAGP